MDAVCDAASLLQDAISDCGIVSTSSDGGGGGVPEILCRYCSLCCVDTNDDDDNNKNACNSKDAVSQFNQLLLPKSFSKS